MNDVVSVSTDPSDERNGLTLLTHVMYGLHTASWFSAGDAEGPNSSFTWAASRDVFISSVSIANNAQNATASFRSGYSFASMTVQLLDSAGHVVKVVEKIKFAPPRAP